MTDWSYETCDPVFEDRASLPRKIFIKAIPVVAAFSFSAAVALRLAGGLAGGLADEAVAQKDRTAQASAPATAAPVTYVALESGPTKPSMDKPRNPFGGLFNPDSLPSAMPPMTAQTDPVGPSFSPLQSEPLFVLVETPESASQFAEADDSQQVAQNDAAQAEAADRTPLKPSLAEARTAPADETEQTADNSAPLPPARPTELTTIARAAAEATPRHDVPTPPGPTRAAASARPQTAPYAQNDPRSLFDKLFAGNSQQQQKGPQLAYASPGDGGGLFGFNHSGSASPSPVPTSGGTAVYDISRHTVYLPSGKALEAHSGQGAYYDDPNHVHVRMHGSTPPATYKLTLRESLFHGVQALRLTPMDSNVYGRGGLLAHTFMLGPRGESNGCVSFRDYRAFLDAYMRGEIRQLRVVASR
jgi:hypothetical protein